MARPGADYPGSLELLRVVGGRYPQVPTKSGLMVGLGETMQEVRTVMHDLRRSICEMLTIGQCLVPSDLHLPVERYCTLQEFDALRVYGKAIGFKNVASGPLVRSSYRADAQSGLL